MDYLYVQGGLPLKGELTVQGSKNTALPMMAASVLGKGVTVLKNVPEIQDVFCMIHILRALGVSVRFAGHRLEIDASVLTSTEIPFEDVGKMRSSIILLGALLGRFGEARMRYPGGCSIGERPIDLHLGSLRQMGAEICDDGEEIYALAPHLHGASIHLRFPSVGATENILLAAVLGGAVTEVENAAREPEIIELCLFLQKMGARIYGAGTEKLTIMGVEGLRGTEFCVAGDRIAAGTYLAAAASAGGEIRLAGIYTPYMEATVKAFRECGCEVACGKEEACLKSTGCLKGIPGLVTAPYPGFPTDMQSSFLALLSGAQGESRIHETIFEGRLELAKELCKMGAEITAKGQYAFIHGRKRLHGACVEARDLRAGAALAVAGAGAEGITQIADPGHIRRGYEAIARDIRLLGGNAWWGGQWTEEK